MKVKKNQLEFIKVLIIGLGNPLAGDDGLGPFLIRYLQQSPLPYGVKALEGGSDAFALVPVLERAERVIVVDVIQTGGRPGTLYRIPLSQLVNQRKGFSQHEVSLLTLYQLPFSKWHLSLPDGVLFAVEVGEIEIFCEELSPTLKGLVPVLAERIHQEVRDIIGVELYPL